MIDVPFLKERQVFFLWSCCILVTLLLFFLSSCLSPVLCSSPVPHPPLEVGLRVGFDKSVDGSNAALWSMVDWSRGVCRGRGTIWRSISSHSVGNAIFPVIKDENPAC